MPGGNGTGPQGLGPMTGRAAGYCAGYPMPGYMNPISGRGRGRFGFGRGWGRGGWGRGWGRGFGRQGFAYPYANGYPYSASPNYADPYVGYPYGAEGTPQEEAQMLKEQAKVMKEQAKGMQEEIGSINDRIKELESTAKKSDKK